MLMDSAKRYFIRLGAEGINLCKIVSKTNKVCKHTQPLHLTLLVEECAAQMMEPIRTIPAFFFRRIVEINHSLWTQLDNNEWIYVAPKSQVLTALFSKHEPTDVKLLGTGKLQLNTMCKAYGNRIFIHSHTTSFSKRTSKYVIPHLPLVYDCCGGIDNRFKLNDLQLHILLRSVINSLDDLRIASHKVEDVENLILEQDWKKTFNSRFSPFILNLCMNGYDLFKVDMILLLLLFKVLSQTKS